ncbi:MAG: 50S ribosomal protein L21 [Bifidobacteriaceae bacterium]|jgi:large subunit ribosomal protein L21|nr:50S ribosomal protein L21 [Bifidobacteriaceae bacterium]
MTYAIIKAGNRQEKVSVGDTIVVNYLGEKEGATVSFDALMIADDKKIELDSSALSKSKVTGKVIRAIEKGEKITILKYKNKTGYKSKMGHRQKQTRVEITGIK